MTDAPMAALNELSQVIGELRSFAAQQTVTNTHIVDELKKISERMGAFAEVGATFVEYRKTLHERFGKIHEQIGKIDETVERLVINQTDIMVTLASWKANWKLLAVILSATITIVSTVVTSYGPLVLRSIVTGK